MSRPELYQGCRTPSDLSTFSASSSEPWLSPSSSAREFYEGLRTPDWLEQSPESTHTQIVVGGGRNAGNARLLQIKMFLMKALLGRSVVDLKSTFPEAASSSSAAPATIASTVSSSSTSLYLIDHVLNLLPSATFDLVSIGGFEEDTEVLVYMILCSLKNSSLMLREMKKYKKPPTSSHKPQLHCPCFDCYVSFWVRWDSSPNRELIHSAIEAFEEHLDKGEIKGLKKDENEGKFRISKLFLRFWERFGTSTS